MKRKIAMWIGLAAMLCPAAFAELEKPGTTYQVFQFPADKIPRIDGDPSEWSIVPDSYAIGMDQLHDDSNKFTAPDPKTLDAKVKVGWVKGENRLYFLYEASDDYWDFSLPTLHNDTFEIAVDGDLSGGPFIGRFAPNQDLMGGPEAAYLKIQGTQAQNYHIFTPAADKDWCMCWNAAQWLKRLPYSNAAYHYDFKPGQPGKLTMEFFVTPFDYASFDGPENSVQSHLEENNFIGLAWAIMDYDDASKEGHTFWNLSPKHTMYGNASELCKFKLMPLEAPFRKPIDARWSFKVLDMGKRTVAFKDESVSEGKITGWNWDFGDGEKSTEQNPIHQYKRIVQPEKPASPKPDSYVVVLEVEGEKGKARFSKVWDVTLK